MSFGMIAGLVVATFLVTSFYFETVTLSERLDKRYNRLNERLDKVETYIIENEK